MAPTTFLALKGKNDPLVFTALDWLVMLHVWSPGAPYMPADLCDASGVLQTLPAGWLTSGEIQKQAAVSIAPDLQTSPIEGYGSSGPRRLVPTSEGLTVDYTAQEWRKINLSLWHNVDLALTTASPGKGFNASKTSSLDIFYYSALLVARDRGSSGDLYPYFKLPKVAVSRRGPMAGNQGTELGLPLTLGIFDDADFGDGDEGGLYDFGVSGAGFDAIAEDAGFITAASSIVVHPSAVELEEGEHLQLTVIDNNGYNRTAECTWGSGTPAVATVSTSGLVTAVSSGSATITATLGGLTDTCAVTVPV
ncbi:Ig-like domain-containing protein [Nocardia puris]|uniref:Ig-like protein group 2 n=1 Tax=Nocardia puris TaxID=208602 RepID=A0A366DAQ3_9NOCA|nr:Ig-like domain-containing protein [Nocardia puris]RBO87025.1 Ig-like protein group 2 [Nocardia puris]